MGLASDLIHKVGHVLGGVRAGVPKLASRRLGGERSIVVSSPSFVDGERLPLWATKDGEGVPPELRWESVPPGTKSIAVFCEDPDAPFPEPFVHWIVYGVAPSVTALTPAMLAAARAGKNSNMKSGYAPAAPPPGHGMHHYHFQVFALDTSLRFTGGCGRREVIEAMGGHVLAWGETIGTYERR